MPIITTTIIQDEENESQIQEIKAEDGKVCFECYEPKKGFIYFALSLEDVGFFIGQLAKCANQLSKEKPDERYSGC
jgi:hypothetical protein